jgi:N-acetylneuraminic acid mutarotase
LSHQAFLSHATEDQDTASRVCALLEADGIGCWLSSRDAKAGKGQAAAIRRAIRRSGLVLFVFSASANASPSVLREIERAVAYGRPVLSLHLDDAVPSASLEYYLNLWQWLAVPGRVEDKRDEIIAAVRGQLALAPSLAASGKAHRPSRRAWVVALAVVLLVAGIGLGLGLGLGLTQKHDIWTELAPTGAYPPARQGHDMVYDSSEGLLIMSGGIGATRISDTWAYAAAANTWIDLNPSGALPAERCYHAMAYDPVNRKIFLFGGWDEENQRDLGDTWSYSTEDNTWTELDPAGEAPSARDGHSFVYDPESRTLILFGGSDGEGTVQNDTWAYDPKANEWTELDPTGDPPPARAWHSAVCDAENHLMIMFGGGDATSLLNGTWAYDPAAKTWTELKPSGAVPPARYGAAMAYDPTTRHLVMFGGDNKTGGNPGGTGGLFNDTWAYDATANAWTDLNPSGTLPPARSGHSMVYDPVKNRLIMFGGADMAGDRSDTWAFSP